MELHHVKKYICADSIIMNHCSNNSSSNNEYSKYFVQFTNDG